MVAGFTFLALLPFMLVVFLVTGVAISFQFFLVSIAFVAFAALRIAVFAKQREFGLFVMIERGLFPTAIVMARLAFDTEATFVLVIFLVTRIAIGLQLLFIQIPFMTILALDIMVLPLQSEFGFRVMIEQYLCPIPFGVTAFALQTKLRFVPVVFFVT